MSPKSKRGKIKFSEYKGKTKNGKKKVDCWSDKNKLKPHEISIGSSKKIWFDCDTCPHDFQSVLGSITNNCWCPYCAIPVKKLCGDKKCNFCLNKSFASYNGLTSSGKKKVDCWSEKNKLKQYEVAISCNEKFWFECDICLHTFKSSLNKVSHKNYERWCPYCSSNKICYKKECKFCFNKSFASYNGLTPSGKKKVDCWSDKNKKKTEEVFKSSSNKYWFKCDVCPHNFESSLANIKKEQWCPYCAIPVKKLCGDKDCSYCLNKSFASYEGLTSSGKKKVDFWSNKNKKKPHEVAICIGKKIWFDCDTCPHDFQSVLSSITNNCWCPYCAIPVKKLCGDKKCNFCLNKSFASYNGLTSSGKKKVDCWSNKNKKKPEEVSKYSGEKFWFNCDTCPHIFKKALSSISNGGWCPYCAGQKLCLKKECIFCFNKSFASYNGLTSSGKKKVDCWSDKNKKKTEEVFKSTGNKYWFNCDVCFNDFDMRLNSISRGRWCPNCKNKTELKLYNWLKEEKNTEIKSVKREYKPKWCSTKFICNKIKKNRYQYRFDFLIIFNNGKKLIIELDGPQHYKQVSNWKPPLHNQIRDKYKEFKAKKHNIDVIRILQEDVYYDRNNWKKLLLNILMKYKE